MGVKHAQNLVSGSALLNAEDTFPNRLLFSIYLPLKSSPSQEVAVIRAGVNGAGGKFGPAS